MSGIPLVSVVMAVRNGEAYLREAVDSVLGQTLRELELIVVDDGSDDATPRILNSYRDPRIRKLSNESAVGPAAARNQALAIARGRYVAIHDADDISHPERLTKQVQFLEAQARLGLVGSYYDVIDVAGRITGRQQPPIENKEIQEALLIHNCFGHGTVVIRRSCLDEVGGYDQGLAQAEDYDLFCRISERSEVANLAEVLYYYRQHGTSLSSVRAQEQRRCARLAVERALERRFREYGSALVSDEALAKCYANLAIEHLAEGHEETAQRYLSKANEIDPNLMRSLDFLVERLVDRAFFMYQCQLVGISASDPGGVHVGVDFINHFFRDLTVCAAALRKQRRKAVGRYYATVAFFEYGEQRYRDVPRACFAALWSYPAWIRNRGALSILLRSLLRRVPYAPG